MPFWKCAVLAFLAIPRYANAEGDDEPENVNDLSSEDTEESISLEQVRKIHAKMDADSNGKVSLDEVLQFSEATQKLAASREAKGSMEELDSDKDGKISLDELLKDFEQGEGGAPLRVVEENKFRAADADGDGLLSEVELAAVLYPETHEGVLLVATQSLLEQKDTDKDGILTVKEFWEGDQVEGEDIALPEEERMAEFKKLDKDGSGTLDVDELKHWESERFHTIEAMKKLMEIADKDNDLHLTLEEIDAAYSTISSSDAQYHFMEWAENHEL